MDVWDESLSLALDQVIDCTEAALDQGRISSILCCTIAKVNGNNSKEDVFAQIDSVLKKVIEQKKTTSEAMAA
ncbi:hypothetical protein Acr_10g0006630 [Actinidia rufa]|uniref:Uncharacterized protein n=1 Tax=Actinidia rufa TaxID=165716 RepID=A0A7J0F994_9ERIC|nr:hypothetical protein Acr_10g0006630 [Actinidia rufa]